jgi:transposase
MTRRSKAISDELLEQAKTSLKELGRSGEAGRRLQAIISAKSKGIKAVAEVYGITRMTLMAWISKFQSELEQGLTIKSGRGRKRKIGAAAEEQIKSMIQEKPHITIQELRLKVMEKYEMDLSPSTIYRLIKRLNFSYITPRPRHYKAKQEQQEAFKKKSATED